MANKVHHFEFEVGNDFFGQYGRDLITEGTLQTEVALDKRETFIEAIFQISGVVRLVCDRSLDAFDQPIKAKKKLVFKYGDTNEELSDEIVMIHRETDSLELGHYIFEFIALELPMKKLHPRYRDEEEDDPDQEGKIIYSSKPAPDENEAGNEDIDPRWEKLRKLK
ncbi:MAG: DUF177 domain-containing protein [Bacteroidota bacterium]|nr:DUF177 domain-containing protein [Bacteroidota bacterium]